MILNVKQESKKYNSLSGIHKITTALILFLMIFSQCLNIMIFDGIGNIAAGLYVITAVLLLSNYGSFEQKKRKSTFLLPLAIFTSVLVISVQQPALMVCLSIYHMLLVIEITHESAGLKKEYQILLAAVLAIPYTFEIILDLYKDFTIENGILSVVMILFIFGVIHSTIHIFSNKRRDMEQELSCEKEKNIQAKQAEQKSTVLTEQSDHMTNKRVDEAKKNKDSFAEQQVAALLEQEIKAKEIALAEQYEKLSRENSEMMVENLIQQYISTSLEIEQLTGLILESLSEALVVNLCSLMVVSDSKKSGFFYDSRSTYDNSSLEFFNHCIEDGTILGRYKNLKKPLLDNQVDGTKYSFLGDIKIQSLMIYPLINQKEWLGMLIVGKNTPNYFEENSAFFGRITAHFMIAINNAKSYTLMEDMAMKDGLTSIYNRTYLMNSLNEEVSKALHQGCSISVILFDIDKFKSVNDTYGHIFGDEVIRYCASIANEIAKAEGGYAARYGGEEFVLVHKGKTLQELKNIAQKLQDEIKNHGIPFEGRDIFVNVSIGIAQYPQMSKSSVELLHKADAAMYHSKQTGRGRISIYGVDNIENIIYSKV